jgi:hypothetical protein
MHNRTIRICNMLAALHHGRSAAVSGICHMIHFLASYLCFITWIDWYLSSKLDHSFNRWPHFYYQINTKLMLNAVVYKISFSCSKITRNSILSLYIKRANLHLTGYNYNLTAGMNVQAKQHVESAFIGMPYSCSRPASCSALC